MNSGFIELFTTVVLNDITDKVEFLIKGTENNFSVVAEIPKDIVEKLKPAMPIHWDHSFVYLNILGVDIPFTKIGFSLKPHFESNNTE